MPSPFAATATPAKREPAVVPEDQPVPRAPKAAQPPPAPLVKRDPMAVLIEEISYMEAMSPAQLAVATGFPKGKVQKLLDKLLADDRVEERKGYYRYECANEWKVKK